MTPPVTAYACVKETKKLRRSKTQFQRHHDISISHRRENSS